MWIVELALRRPHTFVVMAIAILLFGVISITQMAIDIFPTIDVPVVSCVWTYVGMSPSDMENLVTMVTERALTSTVNGIDHIESLSVAGMSVVKVYLNQGTPMGEAVAMVESVGTAILRTLPRGIAPPFVTASSATDVPVIQLGIHSETLTEAELFDIANNVIRSQLATIQGTTTPFPYGGKFRQVMVDIDPAALIATGLSADEVIQALNNQSVINPTGTAKIGEYEYIIALNDMPKTIDALNDIPIKTINEAIVFVRDVAQVHDGYQPQMNIVNRDGKRAVLFNILKSGKASTLSVVNRVKASLDHLRAIVPRECQIDVLTDQSIFVKECVSEVLREALIAAGLTAVMMLALLGSWRSTLIVATSIPLAILSSLIGLHIFGQTINSMTLGGLALAVGMLVDDATVEIENLHRNLDMGKDIETAILDGAQQVALPALVSTLAICIVFVPLLFLTEPSRSLFVPLGMAVVFAMMASYGLSRTIVPLMSKTLLAGEAKKEHEEKPAASSESKSAPGFFSRIHIFIDDCFEAARAQYKGILAVFLDHPEVAALSFVVFYVVSFALLPLIGEDYFPTIDSGNLRLHVNCSPGTRIEETERIYHKIELAIRKEFPGQEIETIIDNIGMPVNAINYAYSDSQTVSAADGEILVTLNEKRSHETRWYEKKLRAMMRKQFPQCTCYFQPADIVTQILNAGLPAPIDVKVLGYFKDEELEFARQIKREAEKIPGAVDVVLRQVVNAPRIHWEVDRVRAKEVGVTQQDICYSLNVSLASSFQIKPNFWVNPKNRITYNMAVQTPQSKVASIDDMRLTAVTPRVSKETFPQPQLLTNLAVPMRLPAPAVVNHINVQPEYDVYVSCQDRDLGGVGKDVQKIVKKVKSKLRRGSFCFMGGQVLSMLKAFIALLAGLGFALVLVYFLLVVNFQSWSDPLIILLALPGAMSGIIWSLFATQTTFSIPALMGTIMTVGVASANSILMVTFANEERATGLTAKEAALNAGDQRFRPVVMTATAMIIGMIPMAIGGGQGGSQNAPIGRAVIGGLTVATLSTLLFVPTMFSLIRGKWFAKANPVADQSKEERG